MMNTKHGGRVLGTPNKITKDLRNILKEVISKELESITENLDKLEPKDRMEVLLKLMGYCMPKLQTLEASYDVLGPEW